MQHHNGNEVHHENHDLPKTPRAPLDHPPFAHLPIQLVPTGAASVAAAVHVTAPLAPDVLPLVCVAGLNRNMSDFTALAAHFHITEPKRPLVLIDLPGRGRATDRRQERDYGSLADARDLADILAALGIGRAVFIGQGHGGQVIMAFAPANRHLLAGTVLVDAGPVADPRGIVRLRSNLSHIANLKGGAPAQAGLRRILGSDYPGMSNAQLEALAQRSHFTDKRGRARPLFDSKVLAPLLAINFDDVLTAQWPLFDSLQGSPLMILRTQLTDQLRRETFEEMVRRRPDATALTVMGQGSPALFDQPEELLAIQDFVTGVSNPTAHRAA